MGVYKELFVFVEGDDDERFFDGIIKPILSEKYDSVVIRQWAQEGRSKIDNYLKSIKSENWNAHYILVTDMDTPCVTAKKDGIQRRFKNVDRDRIMVVIKEIESWYLAVLDDDRSKKFGIRSFRTTEDITKEQFNALIPKEFGSEIDFMQEIVKPSNFDTQTAKRKNRSLRYFVEKYDP